MSAENRKDDAGAEENWLVTFDGQEGCVLKLRS
jgi:hypothetical protein